MINVKELMLGDYVNTNSVESEAPIVGVIHEILHGGNTFGMIIDEDHYFHAEEVFPIKLTKDFFLKNGFEPMGEFPKGVVKLYNEDLVLDVLVTDDDRFSFWAIGDLKYVHEFQNLLRLRGFDDFADNLKV